MGRADHLSLAPQASFNYLPHSHSYRAVTQIESCGMLEKQKTKEYKSHFKNANCSVFHLWMIVSDGNNVWEWWALHLAADQQDPWAGV